MAQPCRTCTHLEVRKIDRALVVGVSPIAIAKQYGLHEDAVYRHKANHLPKDLVAVKMGQVLDAEELTPIRARIENLIDRTDSILTRAEKKNQASLALQAIRELRQTIELLGKATGELRDSPQVAVNLIASPDWVRVRAAVFEALQAYPDARAALASRLLLLEGGQE